MHLGVLCVLLGRIFMSSAPSATLCVPVL